ncbi:hypothetical protein [Mycobacterium tuberculosis]|uniref:hypothetical protein n=1 Tax=Mycobacterium tuberculosis TaxID=1773 RepID=UPI00350F15B0
MYRGKLWTMRQYAGFSTAEGFVTTVVATLLRKEAKGTDAGLIRISCSVDAAVSLNFQQLLPLYRLIFVYGR